MDKLLVVAKREYLERVRSRWFLVVTLLIPAIMAGVLMFPLYLATHGGASNQVRHIAIIDASGSGLGDRIAQSLMADSSLAVAKGDTVKPRVITATPADVAAQE